MDTVYVVKADDHRHPSPLLHDVTRKAGPEKKHAPDAPPPHPVRTPECRRVLKTAVLFSVSSLSAPEGQPKASVSLGIKVEGRRAQLLDIGLEPSALLTNSHVGASASAVLQKHQHYRGAYHDFFT